MTLPQRRRLSALVLLLVALVAGLARPADASTTVSGPQPPPGGPYLGAAIDWSSDSPADYRRRAGVPAAVFAQDVPMPLRAQDVANLQAALAAAGDEGAGLLVTVRPAVAFPSLEPDAVEQLVDGLDRAGVGHGTDVWLRFAPDMNGSWEAYGQQPTDFVRVFDEVAVSVHDRLPETAMVWERAYGAGCPFTGSTTGSAGARPARGPGADQGLDTDGDGTVTGRDDPYAPYWPDPSSVDWVGLTLLHSGRSFPFSRNERPGAGQLAAQLSGRHGYADGPPQAQRDFYARFVRAAGKPMVLQTAARFAPSLPGTDEVGIKRAWVDQVTSVARGDGRPGIGMVVWQELRRREPPTPGLVDWRVTHVPELAEHFRDRLVRGAGLTTATASAGSVQRPTPEATSGTVLRGGGGLLTVAAAVLAALSLIGVGVLRRRTGAAYEDPDGSGRDLRIDLLRGVAICFVVIDHVDIPSLWQLLTQELIGPVSGAELFVALSGVVLGVLNQRRVTTLEHWYDHSIRMWRRALTLWLTALVVIVIVYLVALLPGVEARVVTTFTDPGGGAAAGPRVYDLYAGFSSLADFPLPGWALRDVLLLRMGPSQINIIGLYVVLLLLAPLMTWLLFRGWWPVLLVASGAFYVLYQWRPVRVLPSQFEDPFPVLSWQVLFVLGLVAGWHRTRLVAMAQRPVGTSVVLLVVLLTVAFAVFSWNNPALSNAYDVRLALLPDASFRRVYDEWFPRTTLGVGRLAATVCLLVTAYAGLSRFWVPVHRALGWFLVPLGQATLYVFVLHVFFVVAVANLPPLTDSVLLGTLTHAVILAALWLMVRSRFLFRVVPR